MEKTLFNKVTDAFLEDLSPDKLIAGFIMALVGLFISILMEGATRKPLKEGTPVEWDWKELLFTKVARAVKNIVLSCLVIFVSLRFMNKLIGDFSMLYACLVGFSLDNVKDKWIALREKFFPSKSEKRLP